MHLLTGNQHKSSSLSGCKVHSRLWGEEPIVMLQRVTLGPLGFDDWIKGWRSAWIADPEGNIIERSQGYQDEANPPPLTSP